MNWTITFCQGSGSLSAGGVVMPWPLSSSCWHSAASWAGTGLDGATAPHTCSAVTMSPSPSTAWPTVSPARYSGICRG